jgi:hypothetical protein
LIPVVDCLAATGAVMGMWCNGEGGGGKRYRVWSAMKEGEGSNVAIDGEDFGKEVSRVNETRYKDKAEELLVGPLLKLIETHVYRLGLLRSHRRSCKTDGTFVIDEDEKGCLLGVAKVG